MDNTPKYIYNRKGVKRMLYTLKYIYNNDLDKKYVNVKIVKNTEYYIFIQLLKKIKKALLKK